MSDLRERSDVVDHAGRGLRQGGEEDARVRVLAEQAVDLGGLDLGAPLDLVVHGAAP